MFDFIIQKEAQGWSVWTVAPHTGDKRDWIRDCRTKREALSTIDRMRKQRARLGK